MAEHEGVADADALEQTPGYSTPAPKSMAEIQQLDADDESLVKYKQQLLGAGGQPGLAKFPEDPRQVIVTKLALHTEGRDDIEMDLTGDLAKLAKENPFVIKEGIKYRLKIYFYVQNEIVTGLRYIQRSLRKGIPVDKSNVMVGSYPPKLEEHVFSTPWDDAPTGMVARGTYTVKSSFTDDDKNSFLDWTWSLEIKKDWE